MNVEVKQVELIRLVVKEILKVLYAPHKVFVEIVQNPRYLGALVVVILFAAAQTGLYYVGASKSYSEQTMPAGNQGDVWTENANLWQSIGVTVTNNTADFINATTYFGKTSIEFAINDRNNIQLTLSDLNGSVNCGADGFKKLSFRVKIVTPDAKPENATLYLYSLSDSNFFYYDLTNLFSSNAVWNNITLPVGSGNWRSSSPAASWENITGLKMDFAWPANSRIKLLVDGLFFRGIFKNPIDVYGSEYVIFNFALNVSMQFILQWLLFTGLMFLMIRGLKGNVIWKTLMVAVGFALITLVIQAIILVAAYASLPNLNYPVEVLAGVPGEFEVAYQPIANAIATVVTVSGIIQIVTYVWTIALGAIITRTITEFGWLKSILVSAVSLIITVEFLLPFVLQLFGF